MEAERPALSPQDVRRNFACLVWMGSVFAMGWTEVVVVLQLQEIMEQAEQVELVAPVLHHL